MRRMSFGRPTVDKVIRLADMPSPLGDVMRSMEANTLW